jgi:hypothetical protein
MTTGPLVLAQQPESIKLDPTEGENTRAQDCLRTHVLCSQPARRVDGVLVPERDANHVLIFVWLELRTYCISIKPLQPGGMAEGSTTFDCSEFVC